MSEKKPIVKIVLFKAKEAWYRRPIEDRVKFQDTLIDKQKELGIKTLIAVCKCFYTNEEWFGF